jgi:hypothetical protein
MVTRTESGQRGAPATRGESRPDGAMATHMSGQGGATVTGGVW